MSYEVRENSPHGGVGEETGFAAEFRVGELEEEVGGFPVGELGFGLVKGVASSKVIKKVLRCRTCPDDELIALVTKLVEKLAGGILQGKGLKVGEGGFHGDAEVL